uniref:SET domain-containing protein n=1 Tax=Calcidiscus leptoporus TaxID=127549 RepID=A0A7S0P3Y2_9EUKA|mmetsp:Transcript_56323/g.129324  ORF Transcript_56323/g.129324 Transcript_56323/m.129324 type:complete len:180 (+) Transcript_56323:786-1325(+)
MPSPPLLPQARYFLDARTRTAHEEVVDYLSRLYCNSLTVYTPVSDSDNEFGSRIEAGVALSTSIALFNHSCVPNADWRLDSDGCLCVYALRTVRTGEELCLSYVDTRLACAERRIKLEEAFFFTCLCSACMAGTAWWTCLYCGYLNTPRNRHCGGFQGKWKCDRQQSTSAMPLRKRRRA